MGDALEDDEGGGRSELAGACGDGAEAGAAVLLAGHRERRVFETREGLDVAGVGEARLKKERRKTTLECELRSDDPTEAVAGDGDLLRVDEASQQRVGRVGEQRARGGAVVDAEDGEREVVARERNDVACAGDLLGPPPVARIGDESSLNEDDSGQRATDRSSLIGGGEDDAGANQVGAAGAVLEEGLGNAGRDDLSELRARETAGRRRDDEEEPKQPMEHGRG